MQYIWSYVNDMVEVDRRNFATFTKAYIVTIGGQVPTAARCVVAN